jgi:hypothetical protein
MEQEAETVPLGRFVLRLLRALWLLSRQGARGSGSS